MQQVYVLELHKDLFYAKESDSTETLTRFINTVTRKNMEPKRKDYLTEEFFCGGAVDSVENLEHADLTCLKKGKYLFTQIVHIKEVNSLEKAAELLWLEALWRDLEIDSRIYVRKLEEDSRSVFQLFCLII